MEANNEVYTRRREKNLNFSKSMALMDPLNKIFLRTSKASKANDLTHLANILILHCQKSLIPNQSLLTQLRSTNKLIEFYK